jgi:hypothetical protein
VQEALSECAVQLACHAGLSTKVRIFIEHLEKTFALCSQFNMRPSEDCGWVLGRQGTLSDLQVSMYSSHFRSDQPLGVKLVGSGVANIQRVADRAGFRHLVLICPS